MRINKYLAQATGISRRQADNVIAKGEVLVNGLPAEVGQQINSADHVTWATFPAQLDAGHGADEERTEAYMKYAEGAEKSATQPRARNITQPSGSATGQSNVMRQEKSLDGGAITPNVNTLTLILNKPFGYVCSREGQGSKTVYELIPEQYHHLKPVGRLDKDSSGLLLLTNDGDLAHQLTHPSFQKSKVYKITLNKPLSREDWENITTRGVNIGDAKLSLFKLSAQNTHDSSFLAHTSAWLATLSEGRNRQIRRTFEALGYKVQKLHRTNFGDFKLDDLPMGKWHVIHGN